MDQLFADDNGPSQISIEVSLTCLSKYVSGITMMSASLYHHSYGSEDTFDLDMTDL